MLKRNYPAAVWSAIFSVIALKQRNLMLGEPLNFRPQTIRPRQDAEYEVMFNTETNELVVRTIPEENRKWNIERQLKADRQELHELKDRVAVRIDPKDPRADVHQGHKDVAVKRANELKVKIRAAELALLDIDAPTEERIPVAELAVPFFWKAVPAESSVNRDLAIEPDEATVDREELEREAIATAVEDAYRKLCQTPLPEGVAALGPWESADPEIVQGIRREIAAFVEAPEETPDTRHEAFVKTFADAGWEHGPEYDEESKKHPMLLPYEALPEFVRSRDDILFAAAQWVRHELDGDEDHEEQPESEATEPKPKPRRKREKAAAKDK